MSVEVKRKASPFAKGASPQTNKAQPAPSGAKPLADGAEPKAIIPASAKSAEPKASRPRKSAKERATQSGANEQSSPPVRETANLAVVRSPSSTGAELIGEMIKEPSLDVFYDRHPDTLTAQDYKLLIDRLRADRARFTDKAAAKKEKKEEAEAT